MVICVQKPSKMIFLNKCVEALTCADALSLYNLRNVLAYFFAIETLDIWHSHPVDIGGPFLLPWNAHILSKVRWKLQLQILSS